MTAATRSAVRPVPTGGAWLGLGVAAFAAWSILGAVAIFAFDAVIPLFVDLAGRRLPQDVPPEFGTMLDLALDVGVIVRPGARVVGASGVAIDLALFVAAAMLVRGSEPARRATRALLVVTGLHGVASTVWMVVLGASTLTEWNLRFEKAIVELERVMPNQGRRPLVTELGMPAWLNAVFYGVSGLVGLGVVAVLFWLAGRPFVRDWCAARSGKRPIETVPGRR